MPRLIAEDIKKPMTAKDKEELTSWYSTLLYQEGMRLQEQKFTPTGPWNEKTEREIRLRTFEIERQSHMARLEENLSHLPGAYFDILNRMMHDFETEEIRGLLDENDKNAFDALTAAFREHDHDAFHRVLGEMANGNFPIRDPHTVSEAYFHRAYPEFELADLGELDVEVIDDDLIAATPEIKDNSRFSDKDRAILLKKEVARLEKAEKDRLTAQKSTQSTSKGYYQIYLRETGETLSKAELKGLERRFDEYTKENKQIDDAKNAYFKVKLEQDKLRAKREIMGTLSAREEKKLREYEKKTLDAFVHTGVVKDRILRDFEAKITAQGKDPHSPHNDMRRMQILQGDTRYIPLETEEATQGAYTSLFPFKEESTLGHGEDAQTPTAENPHLAEQAPAPTTEIARERRQLDLTAHVSSQTTVAVKETGKEETPTKVKEADDLAME